MANALSGHLRPWTKDPSIFKITGDILMATVLRELVDCGLLARYPNLDAYRRRGEARPAFARALEAQMQTFRENAPPEPVTA